MAIPAEERDVGLCQVLVILLDTALTFTPDHGSITVDVARHGRQARREGRDSGPRIAFQDLPHLLDRFYHTDKARCTGGTGLAIGRWIVKAHNGTIAVATALGGGALFTVALPLAG